MDRNKHHQDHDSRKKFGCFHVVFWEEVGQLLRNHDVSLGWIYRSRCRPVNIDIIKINKWIDLAKKNQCLFSLS